MNQPKVSVCLVTYNQENYITDCLQSIVTQKTNFPFEIIIGNDASTDNTTAIIEQYVQQYPHLIKHIKREKNVGGSVNYIDVHNQANGEYVCHIDGDDMMLPNKLQIQADFLDANPQYSLVASKGIIFTDEGKEWKEWVYYTKRNDGWEITKEDIFLFNCLFIHSSIMYQKKYRKTKVELWKNMIDTFFVLELLIQKNGYILNNILCKNRKHNLGVTSIYKKEIEISYFKTWKYYLKKYPKNRKYIFHQAFYSLLANLKNRKKFNIFLNLQLCFLSLSKFNWTLFKKIYLFNKIKNKNSV